MTTTTHTTAFDPKTDFPRGGKLAELVLTWIDKVPDAHEQGVWFDGELAQPFIPRDDELRDRCPEDIDPRALLAELIARDADPLTNWCGSQACFAGWAAVIAGFHQLTSYEAQVVDETGTEYTVESAAREALGITDRQAASLFSGYCSRGEVRAQVQALIAADAAGDITSADLFEVRADYRAEHGNDDDEFAAFADYDDPVRRVHIERDGYDAAQ